MLQDWRKKFKIAQLKRNHDLPDLYDKDGYPYWLWKSANGTIWHLHNDSPKDGEIAKINLDWSDESPDLKLADIIIYEEKFRGRGLGSALLTSVKQFARTLEKQRLVGQISIIDLEKNKNLINWYHHQGFTVHFCEKQKDPIIAGISLVL